MSRLEFKRWTSIVYPSTKEKAIAKWAWIEALKIVAAHINDDGSIDPEFGKEIKRYVEARK